MERPLYDSCHTSFRPVAELAIDGKCRRISKHEHSAFVEAATQVLNALHDLLVWKVALLQAG